MAAAGTSAGFPLVETGGASSALALASVGSVAGSSPPFTNIGMISTSGLPLQKNLPGDYGVEVSSSTVPSFPLR